MKQPLIAGALIISTVPLFAQAQQPDTAKLKADAQKVVSIISSDKTKTDTFCQMVIVSKQVDEAIQEKDNAIADSEWPFLARTRMHAREKSLKNLPLAIKIRHRNCCE